MRERSEIATGTDRSLLGNDRINATIQHLAEQLNHLKSHTAKPKREHIRTQENHRAHFRNRERLTNSATVAADKIELQFPQRFRFDFDIGKFAESGADSVDDVTALENFFDDVPRFANSLARFACQFDRFIAKCDCIQLRERNRASSNFHSAILAACAGNDKAQRPWKVPPRYARHDFWLDRVSPYQLRSLWFLVGRRSAEPG